MNNHITCLIFVFTTAITVTGYSSTTKVDTQAAANTWETTADGVTVSLTQILPDQARAFYVNRGFPLDITEQYATSCIFMTVLRNDAANGIVHYNQENWRIVSDGKSQRPLSLASWMKKWEKYDLKKPALLAFRWAQFPQEHWYEPAGDWNQGMLTTGLPAGSKFNLIARWDVAGDLHEVTLYDVQCAK